MNAFISQYSDRISGVITGFDWLVFRGNLAWNHETGRKGYRGANGIAWKDYAQHVADTSQRVKQASLASLEAAHLPVQYWSSGNDRKEGGDGARHRGEERNRQWACVRLHGSRALPDLESRRRPPDQEVATGAQSTAMPVWALSRNVTEVPRYAAFVTL